jgi:hypothetical protein
MTAEIGPEETGTTAETDSHVAPATEGALNPDPATTAEAVSPQEIVMTAEIVMHVAIDTITVLPPNATPKAPTGTHEAHAGTAGTVLLADAKIDMIPMKTIMMTRKKLPARTTCKKYPNSPS